MVAKPQGALHRRSSTLKARLMDGCQASASLSKKASLTQAIGSLSSEDRRQM